MPNKKHIYLASDSPRRKELIRRVQAFDGSTPFTTQAKGPVARVLKHEHIEENIDGLSPERYAVKSAYHKALSASKKIKSGIVIGADTIVVCDGKILGKPHTKQNAVKMLRLISGKMLDVITGLAVIEKPSGKANKAFELTKVKMRKLSAKEISSYVRTGEPLDKAGAFAIQSKGGNLVEWIEGDYFNVVGLPIEKLKKMLG